MNEFTVGIYVPSYKRANAIVTWNLFPNSCTYVVRKSEEQDYRNAGIDRIVAVEDRLIDSAQKVRYWILENMPEDIIVELDDDVTHMCYTSWMSDRINTEEERLDEVYRFCQIMYDLGIGYGGTRNTANLLTYHREFHFSGVIGTFDVFNKAKFKAKPDPDAAYVEDTDRVLQELLLNRIVLISGYWGVNHEMDTNPGGDSENKTSVRMAKARNYLKNKWGRYYRYNPSSNTSVIKVKRQN